MSKIKLLYLISRIDIGGAERQLLSLVSNLDKEKYDICVGYFEGEGELRKEFQDAGIKIKKFTSHLFKGAGFSFMWFWDISIWWRLYQDMKINRYGIVHTHGFKADLWGAIIGRLTGAPVVISTLHNQERYLQNPIVKILEKWVISLIDDIIIAVSDGVKRFLIKTSGISEKKIKKVHYGIDLLDFKIDKNKDIRKEFGIDKDAPLIGCIGRLVRQKGHIYLIQAAKKVIENFPRAKFLIVGKGRLERRLKKLVKNLGLSSSVIFTGFREDIYTVINELNLIVMPSLWEGLGLVILEAMALGKPVVATNIGGIPEIVKDRDTGILIPPKDSKALAEVIIHLLKDRSLAARLGEMGKLTLKEHFQPGKMAEEIERIYNKGD